MSQPYRKKLIEVSLPLTIINYHSAKEKSRKVGKPSSLHWWWARRPFAACRAVLFAQIVDDPSSWPEKFPTIDEQRTEREEIFAVLAELVDWDQSTQLDTIYRARQLIAKYSAWANNEEPPETRKDIDAYLVKNMPIVYDPFCGGGGIPLEAQRLGLRAWGSDLNPVAITISKALIEVPGKFKSRPPVNPKSQEIFRGSGVWNAKEAQGLCEDIEYYGKLIVSKTMEEVGHFYPKVALPNQEGGGTADVIAWIWARTVASPNPALKGAHVPLVKSFILSRGKKENIWIDPVIDRDALTISYKIRHGGSQVIAQTMHKTSATCIFTGDAIPRSYIQSEGKAKRLGFTLMAVVAKGRTGKVYLEPNDTHTNLAASVVDCKESLGKIDHLSGCTNCVVYGLDHFGDLFTARQLLTLSTIAEKIREVRSIVRDDAIASGLSSGGDALDIGSDGAAAYADAISIYLALILDRVADYNSSMCIWNSRSQGSTNTFGRQAIPMVWDFPEANPLGDASGSFLASMKNVIRSIKALKHLSAVNAPAMIFQADAMQPFNKVSQAIISTDPPYYDNIPYSNLSDFFYIWLKKTISEIFPENFSTLQTPKKNEIVANRNRHNGAQNAENFFLDGISKALLHIASATSDRYPVTIFYAYKQSDQSPDGTSSTGWETFLAGVIKAGLAIVGTWPIRTEHPTRMMAKSNNVLASSVVLVCRKREPSAGKISRAEFLRTLRSELIPAIDALQAANIAPTDMPQAAIGPGMAVFSRYRDVLESDDTPMTVKTALQLINAELDEYFRGIEGEFDPETRFAINWLEQYGMGQGNYGDADNLARARGIAVESVKHAGIVESQAGKVRILNRSELDPKWEPQKDTHLTVWECLQYLVSHHEQDGISEKTVLLFGQFGAKADSIKELAYCLYDICANKRHDAKEANAYNALIADWTELTREADAAQSIGGLRQTSMEL